MYRLPYQVNGGVERISSRPRRSDSPGQHCSPQRYVVEGEPFVFLNWEATHFILPFTQEMDSVDVAEGLQWADNPVLKLHIRPGTVHD